MKYLLFPFRSLRALWDLLGDWLNITIALWRWTRFDDSKTLTLDEFFNEPDDDSPKPRIGDSVMFWPSCYGVVKGLEKNLYTVDVCITPREICLRAHEMEIVNEI